MCLCRDSNSHGPVCYPRGAMIMGDFGTLQSILEAISDAPSADNRVPFSIEAAEGKLTLRVLPPVMGDRPKLTELQRILTLMALGAASENAVLRGRCLGIDVQVSLHAGTSEGPPSVQLALQQGTVAGTVDADLEAAIPLRCSNRRLRYIGPRLLQAQLDLLASEASAIPGTGLSWLDDKSRRGATLRILRLAEAERFRDRALHGELFDSIRFDLGWRKSSSEGLPPGALSLPWLERPLFALLRYWPVQAAGNVFGLHRIIGFRAADLPCRFAPNLAVVFHDLEPTTGAFQSGRALQRVWLRATQMGLACQVFAAPALYAHADIAGIRPTLNQELRARWHVLLPQSQPAIVFRIGHSPHPSVRAARRPVDNFGGRLR